MTKINCRPGGAIGALPFLALVALGTAHVAVGEELSASLFDQLIESVFNKFDSDGNGLVTVTESLDGQKSYFAELDLNSDRYLTESEVVAFKSGKNADSDAWKRQPIGSMDTDGDSQVSFIEFAAVARERFARSDIDGSGAVSLAEAKTAFNDD